MAGTKLSNKLTVRGIASVNFVDGQKTRKLSDGGGLTLLIRNGKSGLGRYWQLRYRDPISKTEQTASLGTYPDVGLAQAREKAQEVRKDLKDGITPVDRGRTQKQALEASRYALENTFRAVATAWYAEAVEDEIWSSAKYQRLIWESFEKHVLPFIGDDPIGEITAPKIKGVIRRIGKAGTWETCQRVLQRINMVYRWAEDEGLVGNIPTRPAQRWISRARPQETRERNYPALTPTELPELVQLLAVDELCMDRQTYLAIQLQALTFVRPGELRTAEWAHIDLESKKWTIPATNTKMKREHLVPLSAPALAVLNELYDLNGNRRYVFPGKYNPRKCMSEATVNNALKRLGDGVLHNRHTAHSFRHTASTYLNEYRVGDFLPYRGDPVELQLAHLDKNLVRRRYNKATHWDLRVQMMQVWAEYWLQCADSSNTVVSIRSAG
jgi:integrase